MNKEFKINKQFNVYASRPGKGKTTKLISIANERLSDNKKVMFITLDSCKEKMLKEVTNSSNLMLYDNVTKLQQIEVGVKILKPDVLIIDYIQLLEENPKMVYCLNKLAVNNNLELHIAIQLSRKFDEIDLDKLSYYDIQRISDSEYFDIATNYYVLY